jgi:hypothetical protein
LVGELVRLTSIPSLLTNVVFTFLYVQNIHRCWHGRHLRRLSVRRNAALCSNRASSAIVPGLKQLLLQGGCCLDLVFCRLAIITEG